MERDALRDAGDLKRRVKHLRMALDASGKYCNMLHQRIDLLRRDIAARDDVIKILRQATEDAEAMAAAAQRFD